MFIAIQKLKIGIAIMLDKTRQDSIRARTKYYSSISDTGVIISNVLDAFGSNSIFACSIRLSSGLVQLSLWSHPWQIFKNTKISLIFRFSLKPVLHLQSFICSGLSGSIALSGILCGVFQCHMLPALICSLKIVGGKSVTTFYVHLLWMNLNNNHLKKWTNSSVNFDVFWSP